MDYNRFFGSLLGLAIGDALGAPVEGMKPSDLKRYITVNSENVSYQSMNDISKDIRGYERDISGLHTDDTQYMLVLLDSIVKEENNSWKFDLNTAIKLFKELFLLDIPGSTTGAFRGTGSNAIKSFKKISENSEFPFGVNSKGIGSAMRVGPIALLFMDNEAKLRDFIFKSSLITHTNPIGITAAYAQSKIVIECYKLGELIDNRFSITENNIYDSVQKIISDTYKFEQILPQLYKSNSLDSLISNCKNDFYKISESLSFVSKFILNNDLKHETSLYYLLEELDKKYNIKKRGPSGYAPLAMQIVFFQIFKNIQDPLKAVISSIALGGDTDTIGAMVSTAIYALYGANEIPKNWKKKLIIFKELEKRAKFFTNLEKSKPKNLVEIEKEYCLLVNKKKGA
ncbi:MAG: ADP-ribosylglycohydrolase family protein [Candidatus Heimdallarchaeaceae archaeon]